MIDPCSPTRPTSAARHREGTAIAVDGAGSAYVVGQTQSTAFPGTGTLRGGSDAFVARLAPDGSALAWSTYLGGGGLDQGNGVAVGGDGVVVGGWTTSTDFPTQVAGPGPPTPAPRTRSCSSSPRPAALVWSTYLGGGGSDEGTGVAVDAAGNGYLAGTTDSTNFHIANALQSQNGGGSDAFAAKVTASRRARLLDVPRRQRQRRRRRRRRRRRQRLPHRAAPARPTSRRRRTPCSRPTPAASTRSSRSSTRPARRVLDLPRRHGLRRRRRDRAHAGRSAGGRRLHAVAGLPDHAGAPQANLDGPSDAFVARLTVAGASLAASTYLGGSSVDAAGGVAVDDDGPRRRRRAHAARPTSPPSIPRRRPRAAALDAFVTQLDGPGTGLATSTYLGGNGEDEAHGVAVDGDGNAYVAGAHRGRLPDQRRAAAQIRRRTRRLRGEARRRLGGAAARRGRPRPAAAALAVPPPPPPAPPVPETTITARPPAATPDQVVQFRFARPRARPDRPLGRSHVRLPRRRRRLPAVHVAVHDGEARARRAPLRGARDERQPASSTRRRPASRSASRNRARRSAATSVRSSPSARYHDRGTRDWGPCDFPEIVCPRAAACLLDLVGRRARRVLPVQLRRPPPALRGVRARPVRLSRHASSASRRRSRRRSTRSSRCASTRAAASTTAGTRATRRARSGSSTRARSTASATAAPGLGHAPKPGGDRTTGSGIEQDAHLECTSRSTIQRHVTELADVVSDRAKDGRLAARLRAPARHASPSARRSARASWPPRRAPGPRSPRRAERWRRPAPSACRCASTARR